MRASWRSTNFLHIDTPLLFGLLLLSAIGLVVLYSAGGQNLNLVMQQALRLGLGFFIMLVIAQIRIQQLMQWVPWIYFIGISLLVAVAFVGVIVNGSQRWLDLGLFRFQPSEMMKLALPLMIAWYLADKTLPPSYKNIFITLILIGIPAVLVAEQPDLGTAILIASAGIFVVLLAGISWWLVVFAGIKTIILAVFMYHFVLHDYQRTRVDTLLDPEKDPLGTGYQIFQSKIAIGSGGIYGKGWLNGSQSHLQFLPERTTDFIFAVYSEEFGLFGVILLMSIYIFIITRGMYIAAQAQGTVSRLLAGSLVMSFFVYIFVNIGMVTGVLPVVGVPLPFISYGGTSIVTLMAGFGLLMSIHTHRRLLSE